MKKIFLLLSAVFHILLLYWIMNLRIPIRTLTLPGQRVYMVYVPSPDPLYSPGSPPASSGTPGNNQSFSPPSKGIPKGNSPVIGKPLPQKPFAVPASIPEKLPEPFSQPNGETAGSAAGTSSSGNAMSGSWRSYRIPTLSETIGRTYVPQLWRKKEESHARSLPSVRIQKIFSINRLSPWADRVVTHINKNWQIPAEIYHYPRAFLEIKITIQKNGSLKQIQTLRSSNWEPFEKAVIAAIHLSAPFPPLPTDYPKESMETRLLFQCHE